MSSIDWINYNTTQSEVESILNNKKSLWSNNNDKYSSSSIKRYIISITGIISYLLSLFIITPILFVFLVGYKILKYNPNNFSNINDFI